MASVYVKHIILLVNLQNLEWAVIGALQWFAVSIMSNVHIALDARLSGV